MTDQFTFTPIERRILAYLDQHGGSAHRRFVCQDLAADGTRLSRFGGSGSNGAAPMIMANWCKRLIKARLVVHRRHESGYYRDHTITEAGRKALRACND